VECTAPGAVLQVRFERPVSVGLAKEWNLVLQCGVMVWLRNGIKFAMWGYSLADGLDVLLKVVLLLVKAYIIV
jgi:hypothetical protein